MAPITNEAEACAAILVACRLADEISPEAENPLLRLVISTRNVFLGCDPDELLRTAEARFAEAGSPEALIDAAAGGVRAQSRLPLLYHCLDVILSNGLVTPREHQIFQHLRGKFRIQDKVAFQAMEVLTVKNLL